MAGYEALPFLPQHGKISDLQTAMKNSAALATAVSDFIKAANDIPADKFRPRFETLMQRWARVAGVDPMAYGPLIDGRRYAFVKAYKGDAEFSTLLSNGRLDEVAAERIERAYQYIIDRLTVRFAVQIPPAQDSLGVAFVGASAFRAFYDGSAVTYDRATDSVKVDFEGLASNMASRLGGLGPQGQLDYLEKTARLIKSLRVDVFNNNTANLAKAFETAAGNVGVLDLASRWLVSSIITATTIVRGGSSEDTLDSGNGHDVLIGGPRKDLLIGGPGNDAYVWKRGDGNDLIDEIEGSASDWFSFDDKLILLGVASSQVSFKLSGQDVKLVIAPSAPDKSDGGSVTLKHANDTVELFVMKDGTLNIDDVRALALASATTPDKDIIGGFAGNDVIVGGPGADTLSGGGGADRFVYTTLSDSLLAGYDRITDFGADDFFKIGHELAWGGLSYLSHPENAQGLAADLMTTLSASVFAPNGVALVNLTSGPDAGVYVAINDGVAGFQSNSDAVVRLQAGAQVTASSFIV